MSKEQTNNYMVTINGAVGSCESPLFKKMASKGDITIAGGIKDFVNRTIKVNGFASCHVETGKPDVEPFDVCYIDSNIGMLSTGSEVFIDGLHDYFGDGVEYFRIAKVKCSKGHTFKAVPVLNPVATDSEFNDVGDENPFNE